MEATSYYRYEDSEAFYTRDSTTGTTKEQLQEEDTYGLIFRLNTNPGPFGIEQPITTGIDLERNEFDYKAPDQLRGAIHSDYSITKDKIGPYIQDEVSLINPVKLIVGLRYDWIEFDFTDHKNLSFAKIKSDDMV
jgi:outer membrane receptor protein involved in Fe transport